jgi:hypothetical protein
MLGALVGLCGTSNHSLLSNESARPKVNETRFESIRTSDLTHPNPRIEQSE